MAKNEARQQTRRVTFSPPPFAQTSNRQSNRHLGVSRDVNRDFEGIGPSKRHISEGRATQREAPRANDYHHAQRRLRKKIKKVAKFRAEAKYEQDRVTHATKSMRETFSEFQIFCGGLTKNISVDASVAVNTLSSHLSIILASMREYDEKLVKYGRSSDALGIAEEKLCHQSSVFEEFIPEIEITPPFQFRAGTSEPSSTTASSFSKKGTHHDLVLDYHEKRSDVEIFNERIIDLQDEYEKEKADRSLQRDQNIEPEPSDEEFALYYEEGIQTNMANMEQKRQEMEDAERKCHLLGLDVNIGLIKDWAAEDFETILPDSPQGSVHGSDSPLQHSCISTSERTFQWLDSTDPSGFAFEVCRDIAAFELAAAKEQIASNDYFPEAYRLSGGLRRIHSEPLFSTLWHVRHRPQAADM